MGKWRSRQALITSMQTELRSPPSHEAIPNSHHCFLLNNQMALSRLMRVWRLVHLLHFLGSCTLWSFRSCLIPSQHYHWEHWTGRYGQTSTGRNGKSGKHGSYSQWNCLFDSLIFIMKKILQPPRPIIQLGKYRLISSRNTNRSQVMHSCTVEGATPIE